MIQKTTLKYLKHLTSDPHHRYKSWEHNFIFFKENHKLLDDEKVRDHASLHLAFYLASWGMLRGGSFLLQKDYKIHSYFIKDVVANPKYWVFFGNEKINKDEYITLVEELIDETSKVYREAVTEVNGVKKSLEITDTLISKILLGVYGNVPAYDRYFKAAVKEQGISPNLNGASLSQLFNFYELNKIEFSQISEIISSELVYPPMKLIDMYFFTLGLDRDKENKIASNNEETKTLEFEEEHEDIIQNPQTNNRGTIVQSVREFIIEKLEQEKAAGAKFVELKSGDIHRQLNFRDRLPTVCAAMNSIPSYRMQVVYETASKRGSTNVVRYFLE